MPPPLPLPLLLLLLLLLLLYAGLEFGWTLAKLVEAYVFIWFTLPTPPAALMLVLFVGCTFEAAVAMPAAACFRKLVMAIHIMERRSGSRVGLLRSQSSFCMRTIEAPSIGGSDWKEEAKVRKVTWRRKGGIRYCPRSE